MGGRGGVGETIHMYTANPWFPCRDLSNMENNGLRRPFMTIFGWAQFRIDCDEKFAKQLVTVLHNVCLTLYNNKLLYKINSVLM